MELEEYFHKHPKIAIALSGGADSVYLLWEAVRCGADVGAYFVKTAFQPEFELLDAKKAACLCGAELRVIEGDVLSSLDIRKNPNDRCYHCKNLIFSLLREAAAQDGYDFIIDGTNASDDEGDRPGMRALREQGVGSPLRECGVTKDEIRARSAAAGLFTASKPAYACLATRIEAGDEITAEKLQKIERAENALFGMGFTDFRVRLVGDAAKLQFPRAQLMGAVGQWDEIRSLIKKDFPKAALDLKGR